MTKTLYIIIGAIVITLLPASQSLGRYYSASCKSELRAANPLPSRTSVYDNRVRPSVSVHLY